MMNLLKETPDSPVVQYEIGNYKNFVYLILDWKTKKAAWVDPQTDLNQPLHTLKKCQFELTHIFLTHTHFDHIAGVPELIQLYPRVPILVHRNELHRMDPEILNQGQFISVKEGDRISVGRLQIQVIHTPGHSSGECCYFLEGDPPYLFTGDTVFIRDCGRTDLPTGSNEEMFQSLQKIKKLDPRSIILPGHHYQEECTSKLSQELKSSPPFQCQSVEELGALP